jgi:two-component system OmpR family response regulator
VAAYAGRAEALAGMKTRLPDLASRHRPGRGCRRRFRCAASCARCRRALPIIFLTRDSDDIVAGLRLGADDHLSKDVSLPHLFARIAAAARRAELAGEPEAAPERLERESADPRPQALQRHLARMPRWR